jgi:tartronate-semialdehyde synthase
MPKMNVMDAVVRVMESEGVDVVFGVPGAAILPLYKALAKSDIRHVSVRHEEGGTHAADGYARVTGKVGVNIGTSGPAGTNMITGLYTAMADSIPMICITGQAPTNVLHKEAFQAVDIVEIAKPVTKWAVQVKETAQLPWAFRQAFRIAREGRPGPVLIDLPLDVQNGPEVDWDPDWDRALEFDRPTPNPAAIREAVAMLLQAERPMIMPGGGVVLAEAAPALMALAEYLQVPVTPTYMGKGVIREDHPLCAGVVGIQTSQRYANALFLESDFVLAVGARFADRHTGDLDVYRGERTFVQVDIEPYQIGRAWTERVTELRSTMLRKTDFDDVPVKPQRVYQEVNEVFDEDTVFLTAIGLYQIFSGQFQKTYKPRHYICCGQAGPLGWEVPACIGAKLGAPEKLIVGIVGDYSFQFLMEEVAVAVQYRVPFVLVMLNNTYMGLIRQAEKYGYDEDYAVDLSYENGATVGIDHVGVMEAMGALGRRVTEPGDISDALRWAVDTSEEHQLPVLVEIMTERDTDAAMGVAIDAINEYEPVLDGAFERAGAIAGALPERD